jgi:hypothetical protein
VTADAVPPTRHAFAIVGAVCELVSRQVRLGVPADVLDLAPVIDRLIPGLIPADQ